VNLRSAPKAVPSHSLHVIGGFLVALKLQDKLSCRHVRAAVISMTFRLCRVNLTTNQTGVEA
jgi:hypothetical protein